MRDVAAAAGVSAKTVSRVVNDDPAVGDLTRSRVEQAIADIGYQRNDLASSLRAGRRSATVGLIIGDLSNPFYSGVARAVERVCQDRGHLLITASCEEDEEVERRLVRTLVAKRVDGLLLVPAGDDHTYLEHERAHGSAIVFVDRPPQGVTADAVVLDNAGGAREATEHLLARGHERIAIVGDPPTMYTSRERFDGYRAALEAAGVPVDPALVRLASHDATAAEKATRDLVALTDPPTAVFTSNNRNTAGAVRALRDAGRPVALVGFDDFELADLLVPPVTVVAHDPAEIGATAAELLYRRLDGEDGPPRTVVLPTRLVPRGSGEVGP